MKEDGGRVTEKKQSTWERAGLRGSGAIKRSWHKVRLGS